MSVALLTAVSGLTGTARSSADIRPGTALSPEDLPDEAEHFERLLRGDATADPLRWDDDSVDEKRHFDDHLVHVGFATGLGTPVGLMGAYLEANPWDALAVGAGAGFTAWGPVVGGFARLRPFVWGGRDTGALHAFTLQTSYTYMRHGKDPLGDVSFSLYSCEVAECDEPEPEFVATAAHFMSLGAGFEHATYSGWTFRYELGFAQALRATQWQCALGGRPTACTRSSPSDTLLVLGFAVSHAL